MNLAATLIAIVVSVTTILSSLVIGVKWLVKHYFDDIRHELKPNSGASIKDQVTKLERDIDNLKKQNIDGEEFHKRIDQKLDHLIEVFIDYVAKH
jgi:hypothetical protein